MRFHCTWICGNVNDKAFWNSKEGILVELWEEKVDVLNYVED
jgi:hypothetical protein